MESPSATTLIPLLRPKPHVELDGAAVHKVLSSMLPPAGCNDPHQLQRVYINRQRNASRWEAHGTIWCVRTSRVSPNRPQLHSFPDDPWQSMLKTLQATRANRALQNAVTCGHCSEVVSTVHSCSRVLGAVPCKHCHERTCAGRCQDGLGV